MARRRLWRRWSLRLGALGCALILVAALGAPWLTDAPPKRSAGAALTPPGEVAWFGRDDLGRDTWTNVIYGARTSLAVGVAVAASTLLLGLVIGGVAGLRGGWLDDLLMRLSELFQLLPRFFLAVVIGALFGGSLRMIVLVLGLTFWPATARLTRAQVLALRGRDFVQAATALGASPGRILWRHLLPNVLPAVLVGVSGTVAAAIIAEAALSFLGLGDPTAVSWGQMLSAAQPFLRRAWWLTFFPSAALALTVLSLTLVSDALGDSWRPE